ncbi:hypothetical protein WICMUC_003385 [Wickerhamomyces mucosus]|uniref:Choline transport protein n=1 Tax=Wickerhamomyces mucosus TaxID=1378264 RepID=A0A9P8TCD6_9ASCO|nr:hypothetical protein WICMUC_003385 [Wickerhamomyces mucosus]
MTFKNLKESIKTNKFTVSDTKSSSTDSIRSEHLDEHSIGGLGKEVELKYDDLRQNFTIWSLLGVGFGLTNSWFGISASLVTGISSGGPMLIVYGIIIIASIAACIGISLSELVSAFPENSGGQYYWTFQLAPKKYRRFWAYMCGSFAWFGAIFTSASVTVSIASAIVGMYVIGSGREEGPKTWEVFVTFELINAFLAFFNIYEKPLPAISQTALWTSILSFITITITVLSCSKGNYQTAEFVFSDFNNATGWSSPGIAFIVGLINPAWSFSCLDCATHMCEEIRQPERKIPLAIMATVAIGFTTSFCYAISMFFSIRNLDDILNSNSGVPILDIFVQSVQNKHGALFLEALVVLTAFGCNISSQTWQARLCFSFSRDNGIPGSRYWKKVNKKTGLPVNAHLMTCFWCGVVGCIYMGSTTAYNAMVTGCIIFLLFSYAIPIVALLIYGRNNIKRGPFWLGPFGLLANIVVLSWTLFATVFFSFPFTMPVEADTMNYSAVVLVAFTLYAVVYWFVRANRTFALDQIPKAELEDDYSSSSDQVANIDDGILEKS